VSVGDVPKDDSRPHVQILPVVSDGTQPIVMTDALRRQMRQDAIMSMLRDEEEEEEEEEEDLPIHPVLTTRQRNEQLILRARQLLAHSPDQDESPPHKEATIAGITNDILSQVEQRVNRLKKGRPYAPLSVPYVRLKLINRRRDYERTYERLRMFVASQAPVMDGYQKDLFKERQTRFPYLPPLQSMPSPDKKKKRPPPLPPVDQEALRNAAGRLPFVQRQTFNRPLALPADSDVEVVSQFSSDVMSSDASIPYVKDPEFGRIRFGRRQDNDDLAFSDDSQEMKPANLEEKVMDLNQFAELSSDSGHEPGSEHGQTKPAFTSGNSGSDEMMPPPRRSADAKTQPPTPTTPAAPPPADLNATTGIKTKTKDEIDALLDDSPLEDIPDVSSDAGDF
jgi:hypothetical protein